MKKLDEGYNVVICSNCDAPLCEVLVYNREDKPVPVFYLIAECPHCKDKSYKVQVNGYMAFSSTEYTRALPEYDEDPNFAIIKTEVIKKWK